MPELVLSGVSRNFGGLPAVADLSMTVPPGRITGLIGPNGAGKTTVVNMIAGFLKLTTGSIRLGGVDIGEAEAPEVARAGVARTFQNIRLMAEGTVLENVMAGFHRHETASLLSNFLALPSARAETAALRDKAMGMLERFGMAAFAAVPAGTVSYGHQRRIEMMRALAAQPSVLLLDEPVAGMNDTEASELDAIFREVAAQGVAILLIEHNMRFVMSLCEHIHVLASGRLIAQGTPAEIGSHPDVVNAYLGAEAC
ncbi:ABC transporter ATP-binding protein [Ramlibacter sp.]|uniref:ABC transporter ATP-binding protein n=1 Tax=Ramlibacter sp. TaxID=1917967 RepID=UPI003D13ABCB